jgi:hypothetical protein
MTNLLKQQMFQSFKLALQNAVTEWGDWEIEHSDYGIHVNRVYYPRGKPVTFSASITCAIFEGVLHNLEGSGWETRQLTKAQINQLAEIERIYADAGLYNDLLENRN